MFEALLLGALTTPALLATAYWACLVVGGGLVLLSVLGGEGADADVDVGGEIDFDVDFDADGGLDVDLDADLDAADAAHMDIAALSTWFSMRFVVFFVAAFGAIGVILHHLTAAGAGMTFGAALIAGLVIGQSVHQVFRTIRRTSGDSTPQPRDYVNKLARVTIPIAHPNKGEVAIQVRSARRFVPAVVADATSSFGAGDEVVVVGYRAGVARVISREEFEQKARST